MSVLASHFHDCRPTLWNGRYAKIPGDTTAFHLHRGWPVVLWDTDEGRATCKAIRCEAANKLAESVARAKRSSGANDGGAFLINEFGQVLVPSNDNSGRRYFAGRLEGTLLFENPFCPDDPIDFADYGCLQPGDPWKLPYVGVPHILDAYNRICFRHGGEWGTGRSDPAQQDQELIGALIRERGKVGCRFIVNHAGVVLTKSGRGSLWHPVYIGNINRKAWFEMERGGR